MRVTAVLLYYTSVLHTPKGHRAGAGENPGEVACRVRIYIHADEVAPVDGMAILEETHTLSDLALTEHASDRKSAWDESDIRALLVEQLDSLDII